jgi:hypothetical protein
MRVDRRRATRMRSRGGYDPEPLEFGRSGGKRIHLPIQLNFDHHDLSSSIEYCETASGVLKIQSEAISPIDSGIESTFHLRI